MTLQNQISLFTEDRSTSSQADFLVSPTPQQESDSARKMTATSGRKCLEQYGRFNRHGLWAKTFSALLIGMGDWYSTRCKLTWKLKGTKYNRMYFQLYPSTLPTEETEYGLWPTPTSVQRDHPERVQGLLEKGAETMMSRKNGDNRPNSILDMAMFTGILPTPKAWDGDGGGARPVNNGKTTFGSPGVKDLAIAGLLPTPRAQGEESYETRAARKGHKIAMSYLEANVEYQVMNGMLPTPMASDCGSKVTGLENQDSLVKIAREITGKTSQLNPRFVLEMIGFPPDWTELPFLNGETNQSKQEGMQ
jgi:hypothetical protein